MSYPKPWVLGDTIINDGIDWTDAEWSSALRGWQGLPAARALLVERYGKWPVIAGIRRPGRNVSLETHFMQSTEALRKTARVALLDALDYEEETPYRLLCTDFIPPNCATNEMLLALGPLDVQTDGAGAWTIRDLIDPDNVEATISGAVHFVDAFGDGLRAIVSEEEETNYILNPSFEVNVTDGWTNDGGNPFNTFAQSAVQFKFGSFSVHCISDAAADNAYCDTVADADAAEIWTASCWVYLVSGDFELFIEENNAGWLELTSVTADDALLNQWQKVSVTGTLTAGVTDGRVKFKPEATAISEFYVDGVNFVQARMVSTHVDGSLGPGYVWDAATPHNDTSTRTKTRITLDDHIALVSEKGQLTFRAVVMSQYDYDDDTWPHATYNMIATMRGATDNDRIAFAYYNSTNSWAVYINGAWRISETAVAFEAGDRLEVVVTVDFDADDYNLYVGGVLLGNDTTALTVPTLTDWELGATQAGLYHGGWSIEQYQVVDRVLTAAEVAYWYNEALNARWLKVLCDQMSPLSTGGKETTLGFVANLMIDDDVRFHSRDGDVHFVELYESPWDTLLAASTEDEARPVLYLTPTVAKTSGFLYKSWVPIVWKGEALNRYPTKLGELDTNALVGAGKMLATCNDLRVYDGLTEIDRWILDPNTATTDIWVNLDWSSAQAATLEDAIGIGDTVTSVQAAEDIGGFPSIGRFMVNNEAFTYRGKNESSRTFLNVVRAAKGTAAANHLATDDILWIEHDLWIYYDDATLGAPVVDADNEPLVELDTSTNDSWIYAYFGGNARPDRPYTWVQMPIHIYDVAGYENFYTANHIANADPWEELGVYARRWDASDSLVSGRFYLYNPLGITNAHFTNGEERYITPAGDPAIQSSLDGITWVEEYNIPPTGPTGVWNAWSRDEALEAGSKYVALYGVYTSDGSASWVEAADVEITLDNTYTPDATIGAEQGNYALDCTIASDVSGKTIQIQANIQVDSVLEVDTESKTVIDLTEGENLFGALTLIGGVRRHWFPILDGDNVLTYTETDAVGISLELIWDRRYRE